MGLVGIEPTDSMLNRIQLIFTKYLICGFYLKIIESNLITQIEEFKNKIYIPALNSYQIQFHQKHLNPEMIKLIIYIYLYKEKVLDLVLIVFDFDFNSS